MGLQHFTHVLSQLEVRSDVHNNIDTGLHKVLPEFLVLVSMVRYINKLHDYRIRYKDDPATYHKLVEAELNIYEVNLIPSDGMSQSD